MGLPGGWTLTPSGACGSTGCPQVPAIPASACRGRLARRVDDRTRGSTCARSARRGRIDPVRAHRVPLAGRNRRRPVPHVHDSPSHTGRVVGERCQLTCNWRLSRSTRPGDRTVVPSPLSGVNTLSKRTFQPNNRRRHKTHGFRLRMRTRAGRAILSVASSQGPQPPRRLRPGLSSTGVLSSSNRLTSPVHFREVVRRGRRGGGPLLVVHLLVAGHPGRSWRPRGSASWSPRPSARP